MVTTLARLVRARRATVVTATSTAAAVPSRRFAGIEELETRTLMSAATTLTPPAAPSVSAITDTAKHAAKHANKHAHLTSVLPLKITGVTAQNGQIVATGLLGSTPFSVPITVSSVAGTAAAAAAGVAAPAATTPVLNLHLGPINLNLLGLKVDTSQICLDITAQSGPGNLLGNLLTDIANLLNGGSSLGSILGGLTSTQLTTLTTGLTSLLNGVFGQLTSPAALAGVSGAATNILNLSLGPVNLNLLGLNVALDNCAGGPVTLDITAVPGPGNLLGNLLGGLSHLLDTNAATAAIDAHLRRIAGVIQGLLG